MTGNYKAIVLSDMLSDSIEYKNRRSAQLICDPKSIPIFSIISHCSVGYARVVEQSEKFDNIKYQNRRSAQLICDPKNIQICFLHINLHHAIVR